MPKILMLSDITGLGPDYHVGDEAMAEVAIERLGKLVGKENLILGCAAPERVPATYGVRAFAFYHITDDNFRRMLWTKPLSYFKSIAMNVFQVMRCDKVVVCGGGNMTSVWPGVLESRLRLLKVANFFKKDVVLVSQTIGPYEEAHRARVDRTLAKAKWIGVRDVNFSHTQVSAPVHFALDDACYLEQKHSDYSRSICANSGTFACVSMRKFGGMDDADVLRVASSIERTVRAQHLNTVFIPHHAPMGVRGDIELAQKIKHLWAEDGFHLVDPIPLASELKALTSDSKLVVSMRYHQLVFALSIGIPAVGIYVDEYTQAKLTGSFEALGLKPLVTSIQEVEKNLSTLVSEALDAREQFEAAARKIQQEDKSISERPYNLLADITQEAHVDAIGKATEAKGS
ncbi:polysaccharide pyruvyl transferase family protein [Marinobacter sp. F4206]|uniref:polysaccharide pyruvyl transferase family protein n=1 Tax=Marinobacter sp. F4206 TaxID=2861777 RepID=UPI001C5F6E5C|nr:polysaccharide pyruvyl transferase family protein [Marinobacter sp. F4206]MBW4933401.1 polysaccharide pyruvyl transferase family protein [Marinobacter sp. F4206]